MYGIIDTETGGLDPSKHSLLSIGMILTNQMFDTVAKKEWMIRHDTYVVTEEAMSVNQIDLHEHNKKAQDTKMVAEDLIEFIAKYLPPNEKLIIVGQNTIFDLDFITHFLTNEVKMESWNDLVDRHFVDLQSITAFFNMTDVLVTNGLGLDHVLDALNIPKHNRHSALADAEMTKTAMSQMINIIKEMFPVKK